MSTDPIFLWLGEKHKEALATLKYAIFENKGVLALTGDVGTGKTTLINALIKELGKDIVVATIYDPGLKPLEFFNIVAVAFNMGMTFKSKGQFLIRLRQFLKKARGQNQKVLLIIDEAQRISPELLEEIRLLSNLEAEHVRLLNIFFVGQNEFIDLLRENVNRALRQRIAISYNIDPLTISETETYVEHRLQVAGAKAPIFTPGAIQEIFAFSSGYPRLINIICDHALLSGFVKEVRSIDSDIIRECKKDLQISEGGPPRNKDIPAERVEKPLEREQISELDASRDDENEFVRLTRGLYRGEPVSRIEKRPIGLAVLAVALLFLIGGAALYFYHNPDKIKAILPDLAAFKKDGAPYSKQSGSKKDNKYLVPFIPETPKKETKKNTEKIAAVGNLAVNSSEPDSLKEIKPEDVENSVGMSSKTKSASVSDKPKTSEIETGKSEEKEQPPIVVERKEPAVTTASKKQPEKTKKTVLKPVEPKTQPKISEDVTRDTIQSKKKETRVKAESVKEVPEPTVPQAKPVKDVPEPTVSPEKERQALETVDFKNSAPEEKILPKEKGLSTRVDQSQSPGSSNSLAKRAISLPDRPSEGLQKPLLVRLNNFLSEYCKAYESKQLDKFTTFFTSDALEKGKPFPSQLPKYRRNFEIIESLNYRIDLKRYSIIAGTELIKIEGTYYARARLVGESGEWRQISGTILMELAAHGDSFRVRRLDY